MKIKLDENLSQSLCEVLARLKHDVDTVVDEDLAGVNDVDVLKAAVAENRILFTLDTDFLNLKAYPPASHKGIVVFRPPTQGVLAVVSLVEAFVRSADLRKHLRRTTIVERTRTRIFK
jgi:hypothetical protein